MPEADSCQEFFIKISGSGKSPAVGSGSQDEAAVSRLTTATFSPDSNLLTILGDWFRKNLSLAQVRYSVEQAHR
jgi:hypothetical protein